MNAIDTFRWTSVDRRKKRHLWLGRATACGITEWSNLSIDAPEKACKVCVAYGEGWLDRHVHGPKPPLHVSPIGAATRLPEAGS